MLILAFFLLSDVRADLNRALDAQLKQVELIRHADELRKAGKLKEAQSALLDGGEEIFYEPEVYRVYLEISEALNTRDGTAVPHADVRKPALASALSRRLKPYEESFRALFRDLGVPEDLIYVGLVESGFNPEAVSPAGAAGMWQFVPATASRYGLRRFGNHDERKDPVKSARAAALYLRDLNRMFGNWPLALAAYNAGEYRIARIMAQSGIRDFWELRRRGLLPRETAAYVPAVLAAANRKL